MKNNFATVGDLPHEQQKALWGTTKTLYELRFLDQFFAELGFRLGADSDQLQEYAEDVVTILAGVSNIVSINAGVYNLQASFFSEEDMIVNGAMRVPTNDIPKERLTANTAIVVSQRSDRRNRVAVGRAKHRAEMWEVFMERFHKIFPGSSESAPPVDEPPRAAEPNRMKIDEKIVPTSDQELYQDKDIWNLGNRLFQLKSKSEQSLQHDFVALENRLPRIMDEAAEAESQNAVHQLPTLGTNMFPRAINREFTLTGKIPAAAAIADFDAGTGSPVASGLIPTVGGAIPTPARTMVFPSIKARSPDATQSLSATDISGLRKDAVKVREEALRKLKEERATRERELEAKISAAERDLEAERSRAKEAADAARAKVVAAEQKAAIAASKEAQARAQAASAEQKAAIAGSKAASLEMQAEEKIAKAATDVSESVKAEQEALQRAAGLASELAEKVTKMGQAEAECEKVRAEIIDLKSKAMNASAVVSSSPSVAPEIKEAVSAVVSAIDTKVVVTPTVVTVPVPVPVAVPTPYPVSVPGPAVVLSGGATPTPTQQSMSSEPEKAMAAAPKETEKEKAERKAVEWWAGHPRAEKADKARLARKVVTRAKDYKPSFNDFRGVDTP